MKAVYESSNPYSQVGYWDVNGVMPVRDIWAGKEVVGSYVDLPENESQRTRSYLFSEGKKHNQLTIEDPIEILNMRAWVKYHPDFKEVSCEDIPEDLRGYTQSLKPEEPEKVVQAEHRGQDTSSEGWDEKMRKRFSR